MTLERGVAPYAEGSCLATFGLTRVLCTATVEEGVPGWLQRGSVFGSGGRGHTRHGRRNPREPPRLVGEVALGHTKHSIEVLTFKF